MGMVMQILEREKMDKERAAAEVAKWVDENDPEDWIKMALGTQDPPEAEKSYDCIDLDM